MRFTAPIAAFGLAVTFLAGCNPAPSAQDPVRAVAEPSEGLRESGPARYARTHPDFAWVVHDTKSFRLYAEAGPGADGHLRHLGEEIEQALQQARSYVGRRHAPGRIPVYFVHSRERMEALVGRTPGGMAVPKEDVAFFVASPDGPAPALVHELTHLEAWEAFGERAAAQSWLDEGVATASVGRCYAYTLDEAGAAVIRQGRDVPLAELASSFDVTDPADYLQAGSLIAWVHDRWGVDAVAVLWRSGLEASERATGLDAQALDTAWRVHVTASSQDTQLDWAALKTHGCEAEPDA